MSPAEQSCAIIVFMRAPFEKRVKTRLAKTIGRQRASQFYSLCVNTVVDQMMGLAPTIAKYIFLAEPVDAAKIKYLKDRGFSIEVQEGVNLGDRLCNAFYRMFQKGIKKTVIVASDVPDLSAVIVKEAIHSLDGNDLVIGPSHDGGYYLIGIRKLDEFLFDGLSWGTERVLRQTLDAADRARLRVWQLPTLMDIDTEADLCQWADSEGSKNRAILDFVKAMRL